MSLANFFGTKSRNFSRGSWGFGGSFFFEKLTSLAANFSNHQISNLISQILSSRNLRIIKLSNYQIIKLSNYQIITSSHHQIVNLGTAREKTWKRCENVEF